MKFSLLASHFVFGLSVAAFAATLEPNTRLEIDAVIPNGKNVTLSLGRGKEKLTISAKGNDYPWQYTGTKGEVPSSRPHPRSSRPNETLSYWWEHREYTPNGRYVRSFATSPAIAAASEAMMGERWQTSDKRHLALAVELSDGWLSFYVDDILLHALPATADVAGRELKVAASKGTTVSEPVAKPVTPAPGYWRVPLGRVASLPGNPLAGGEGQSGDGRTEFGQNGGLRGPRNPSLAEQSSAISTGATDWPPFLPAEKSVAVGCSWTREASANEVGCPNSGTYGGRWAGALSATPCRLQFRVPNRRYEAMYLLASCTSNNFLTVQFYRPGSGFPVDCLPAEPIATNGALQVIRVPLRQDKLAAFGDREVWEFELTGHVENYRAHPEPAHYSRHGVGEPSGVAVHAITLKEAALEIDFEPEAFANVWVGSTTAPAYLLTLRNKSREDRTVRVTLETRSHDGADSTRQECEIAIPALDKVSYRFATPVGKYGWHSVTLAVDGEPYERSLVVLRARDYKARPFDAPGLLFSGTGAGGPGVHFGLPAYDGFRLVAPLGIASSGAATRTDVEPLAKKYGVRNYVTSAVNTIRPAGYMAKDLEQTLLGAANRASDVCDPSYQLLFAEPGGIGRNATVATLCGEPFEPRTEAEQAKYMYFKTNLIHFSEVYHRAFPGKKLLMPWGSPLFTVAYLQDPETRNLFEGVGFDTAFFDRLPEGQLHSCSLYVLTLLNREWRRYRDDKPLIVSVEGPCLSREAPESLTPEEHMHNTLRSCLILSANGVTRIFSSMSTGTEVASYWGEQHYSGGSFSRITLNPYRLYAAAGTMIRLLSGYDFVRALPTGSLGTFAFEYRNTVDGKPLHVLWCIRGKVPFKAKAEKVFDCMDNLTSTRFVTPDPIFVIGCTNEITFGKQVFDKADTTPAADAVKVADLAVWTQTTNAPEAEYLANMPGSIVRHPVEMKVARDGNRLSVCLPEGLPDKGAMPFCTTLVPPEPVVLPGRPRILALDVETEADWGRVVYVLRDAKGEKFISVGRVRTYNVDDTKCDSFFSFSGRRLVRFELPGNRPWDASRLPGSCWWGAYGGDGVVDYPLSIEKIFIERRTKAMYANDIAEIEPKPALLGALYAEAIDPDSDLRMPPPPAGAPVQNPIAEINGTLDATEITGVTHPAWQYDGRRGHFAFKEMEGAKDYDIYVSLSPTGEGAILLKKGAMKSGELVTGFLPETDNYAFIVWHDAKGATSKPSAPFKFMLHDEFAEK